MAQATITVTLDDEVEHINMVAADPLGGSNKNTAKPISLGLTLEGKIIVIA